MLESEHLTVLRDCDRHENFKIDIKLEVNPNLKEAK
jgi:hypothetical protein